MTSRLRAMLEADEGRVPHAYQDSRGYWTIGVGHLIDKRRGGRLPEYIIDLLLDYDISEKTRELVAMFPWVADVDGPRRAVLIAMTFQLGGEGLAKFGRALAAMRRKDYAGAAEHFLDSEVARTQAPARWDRFAAQIVTGEWQ